MKKRGDSRIRNRKAVKTAAAFLVVIAMAASLAGCGGKKQEEAPSQEAVQEAAATSAADAENGSAQAEAEETAKDTASSESTPAQETTPAQSTPANETASAEEKEDAKEPDAQEEPAEPEVIKKPEPEEASIEQHQEEADSKKKKEKKKEASSAGLALLDGKMVFDGMELEFPTEPDGMKIGKWTLSYQDVEDPDSKVLAPSEIVTAVMTSDSFSAEDVKVIAEFGNYTGEEKDLTDLPMTGIYITAGKGKDGNDPKLPEVTMPGGLTWGSTKDEIRELFGEASLSGTFVDMDFDYMYENGEYMIELGGMDDTGLSYIVYCQE